MNRNGKANKQIACTQTITLNRNQCREYLYLTKK